MGCENQKTWGKNNAIAQKLIHYGSSEIFYISIIHRREKWIFDAKRDERERARAEGGNPRFSFLWPKKRGEKKKRGEERICAKNEIDDLVIASLTLGIFRRYEIEKKTAFTSVRYAKSRRKRYPFL